MGVGEIDPEGPGSLPEGLISSPTQNDLIILVLPQQF